MQVSKRKWTAWFAWGLISVAASAYLAAGLLSETAAATSWLSPARKFLLPGRTSHGHHQIELACESCHTRPFGTPDDMQSACEGCHAAELKEAEDKHPLTKFLDPRNASLLEKMDARQCVTCHVEHRPEITQTIGVTRPDDLCFHCHTDIAGERPSHRGMGFETCGSSGCHNFHDGRALYEDFLTRHASEPDIKPQPRILARDFRAVAQMLPDYPGSRYPVRALDRHAADAPAAHRDARAVDDWLTSNHARAGVNCSACHMPQGDDSLVAGRDTGAWIAKPEQESCKGCHPLEIQGFLAGKHGMRMARGLGPMRPADALIPMKSSAADYELTCTSCHGAHRFDTAYAAVEACMGCHDDSHSRAYTSSPHFNSTMKARSQPGEDGTGVTCATCHMPRTEFRDEQTELKRVLVQHNQNDTLRPSDKMLRPVCMNCHGLGFSMDALADRDLVTRNFSGAPRAHVPSIDMAVERAREADQKRGKSTSD